MRSPIPMLWMWNIQSSLNSHGLWPCPNAMHHCPATYRHKSKAQEAAPLGGRSSRSICIKMGGNYLKKHIINQSNKQISKHRSNPLTHIYYLNILAFWRPHYILVFSQVIVASWFLVCRHPDSFACPIFSLNLSNQRAHLWILLLLLHSYTQLGKNRTTVYCCRQFQGQQSWSGFQGPWSSFISLDQFFHYKTWWLSSTTIF